IPKWRRPMQQGHCRSTSNCGGCCRETGCHEKASNPAEVTKREWPAKPPLKQPSHKDGLASIAKPLEYGRRKASVANQVGSDSANYHANDERWTGARPKRDQNSCGET